MTCRSLRRRRAGILDHTTDQGYPEADSAIRTGSGSARADLPISACRTILDFLRCPPDTGRSATCFESGWSSPSAQGCSSQSPAPASASPTTRSPLEKVMEKVNKQQQRDQEGDAKPGPVQEVAEGRREELQGAGQAGQGGQADQGRARQGEERGQSAEEVGRADGQLHRRARRSSAIPPGRPAPIYDDTKKAWNAVNKSCTDCHTVFRVDENF